MPVPRELEESKPAAEVPIVYACSGDSSAAKHLALQLDRDNP